MIKQRFFRLVGSDFNKNFFKVFSGASIASIISVIVIPISTRLYSPEQFGVFQQFASVVLVFSSISSFRYELAIVLPKKRQRSEAVTLLALICLLVSTLAYSLLFFFLGEWFLNYINAVSLVPYLILIPISIFVSGLFQICQFILVSSANYGRLSRNKVFSSLTNQSGIIGLGAIAPSAGGLAVSYMASQLVASILVLKTFNFQSLRKLRFKYMLLLAKRYKKFPLVNSLNVFLNTMSLQMPVFLLGKYFNAEVVGIYMLANRLLELPLALISSSVAQVYMKSAADCHNIHDGQLKELYLSTLKKLICIASFALIVVFIFADIAVDMIFGSEWINTSLFMQILIIYKFFQFLNSPLSSTFVIVNKQELALGLILVSIVARYFSMLVFKDTVESMLYAFTVSSALFYILFNYFMYRVIK